VSAFEKIIATIRLIMKPLRIKQSALSLLLLALFTNAHAQTIDYKSIKLSAGQRASLQRFLTEALPDRSFDWNSLKAHAQSIAGKRQPLAVTMSTMPASTAAGICRNEQHRFHFESGKKQWQADEGLTRYYAWAQQDSDCAAVPTPIAVSKALTDMEFLFIEREKDALRGRAAGVIGGSDCARVRYCEVTLRRIDRVREEISLGKSRTLTKLTYSPLKPGPACLYVMEVSFVGALNELVPLGASCPKP
jgi:hypothetical protein